MTKIKLDKEEQDLVDSFERGEWRSVPNFEREKKKAQKIAAATFKKDRRVNIRISSGDLIGLQKRANKFQNQEIVSDQTSLPHKLPTNFEFERNPIQVSVSASPLHLSPPFVSSLPYY